MYFSASTLQACTLLLTVLFVYDVFFVFITPLFTKVCRDIFSLKHIQMSAVSVTVCCSCHSWPFTPQSGESIMVEVAAGPSDSSTHEKVSLF